MAEEAKAIVRMRRTLVPVELSAALVGPGVALRPGRYLVDEETAAEVKALGVGRQLGEARPGPAANRNREDRIRASEIGRSPRG